MPPELTQLFHDLNKEGLRIKRPSKFIFLCGGAMNPAGNPVWSLRQYLLRDRRLEQKIDAQVVLAERANQLYRDTNYRDLVTFEEDIARIAALVFLVAESAGSLAELGAFTSLKAIRQNLAILIQTDHERTESFVRYGPVQRLMSEDPRRVGVYPWRTNKKGHIVKNTARPHATRMIRLVKDLLKRSPAEEAYRANEGIRPFILILWILYLAQAIPITDLIDYISDLAGISQRELRNKLYCMQLAGWVDKYAYENKVYWYATSNLDPISRYSFIDGVVRDTARRKAEVVTAINAELRVPRHVRAHVAAIKGGAGA